MNCLSGSFKPFALKFGDGIPWLSADRERGCILYTRLQYSRVRRAECPAGVVGAENRTVEAEPLPDLIRKCRNEQRGRFVGQAAGCDASIGNRESAGCQRLHHSGA